MDGEHHFTEEGGLRDGTRDLTLRELGYVVLRIPGYEVLRDPRSVREQIERAIVRRRGE